MTTQFGGLVLCVEVVLCRLVEQSVHQLFLNVLVEPCVVSQLLFCELFMEQVFDNARGKATHGKGWTVLHRHFGYLGTIEWFGVGGLVGACGSNFAGVGGRLGWVVLP